MIDWDEQDYTHNDVLFAAINGVTLARMWAQGYRWGCLIPIAGVLVALVRRPKLHHLGWRTRLWWRRVQFRRYERKLQRAVDDRLRQ